MLSFVNVIFCHFWFISSIKKLIAVMLYLEDYLESESQMVIR